MPRLSATIAFAGGGTAGHLYPALAVANALRNELTDAKFVFFTTGRTIDRFVLEGAGRGVMLVRQPVEPLSSRPWTWPRFTARWRQSVRLCRQTLRERPPLIVIGSGGYASVPPLLAARRLGIPTAILNPDAIPGRANRLLGRRADLIFAQWVQTAAYFRNHKGLCVSGCPVRPEFGQATREQGIARFGLDPSRKTLLVTGASLGARTINDAVVALLPEILALPDWQVLLLTGPADYERIAAVSQRVGFERVHVLAYTEHMAEALAAADLVVARAGASTLAELTAVGAAAVLMPYPFHRDQHQLVNARVLTDAGAARLVEDQKDALANAAALRTAMLPLLRDAAARESLQKAARRIGTLDSAARIARRIVERVRGAASGATSAGAAWCLANG